MVDVTGGERLSHPPIVESATPTRRGSRRSATISRTSWGGQRGAHVADLVRRDLRDPRRGLGRHRMADRVAAASRRRPAGSSASAPRRSPSRGSRRHARSTGCDWHRALARPGPGRARRRQLPPRRGVEQNVVLLCLLASNLSYVLLARRDQRLAVRLVDLPWGRRVAHINRGQARRPGTPVRPARTGSPRARRRRARGPSQARPRSLPWAPDRRACLRRP